MKILTSFVIIFSSLMGHFSLEGISSNPEACYKDLQLNFFQESIVYQALSFYEIPQGLWAPITQSLKSKSYQVPARMGSVTANMVPNPTEYPMQPGPTARILKQVLLDIFYETMTNYQVNERPTADFVFDYIFTRQLGKFIECFGEEVRVLAPKFD